MRILITVILFILVYRELWLLSFNECHHEPSSGQLQICLVAKNFARDTSDYDKGNDFLVIITNYISYFQLDVREIISLNIASCALQLKFSTTRYFCG